MMAIYSRQHVAGLHAHKVILYSFFSIFPRRLNFMCRRFGTLCTIFIGLFLYSDPPLTCHSPSYRLRLFSSQTFSRINTPTFSTPVTLHTYPSMKMEQTVCSETSAYKIQAQGNYPKESIQQSEHDESLKSRQSYVWTVILQHPLSILLIQVY